ncbi:MAG: metallophosphoesterase family protein [bacterium]
MIFITGDIHGPIDIKKLNSKNFPEGQSLTKKDYVICTGDFGLVFDINESGKEEKYWLNWLTNKNWTTLFVDGNHENFDRLYKLPEKEMFNGKVGIVNDSIFHLKRGEIYEIEGNKFFTFGGAESIDKENRYVNISWWREEIPSYKEMMYAINNLKKHNNEVDYILTHTIPVEIVDELNNIIKEQFNITQNIYDNKKDDNARFLSEILKIAKFKKWFFGHFHEDVIINDKFICQYENVQRLE